MDGEVPTEWTFWLNAEYNRLESMSVLRTHQVIKDWIECGRKKIEAARRVEEILIDDSEERLMLEICVSQSLDVKRSPGQKEKHHN